MAKREDPLPWPKFKNWSRFARSLAFVERGGRGTAVPRVGCERCRR
jgi:hypothetical protein